VAVSGDVAVIGNRGTKVDGLAVEILDEAGKVLDPIRARRGD